MKKILLSLAALLCVATVSAQGWAVGGRFGTGLQAQGEYHFSNNNYVEARLGFQYVDGVRADFTALYNWNVCTMDWTPSAGEWFFDAGVGVNVGGISHLVTLGVAGQARLGIKFNSVPLRLSFDFAPAFGPWVTHGFGKGNNGAGFYKWGICNFGVSAVYCF